jgi:nicotinamide-nucleotide amidase
MAAQSDEVTTALADALTSGGTTVGVAESLTGGALSARLAAAPSASQWFRGALVSYSSEVKHDLLRVPDGPVVSEAAATAMAEEVARLLDADVAVSTTGVGGPDPQDGEPPGTVWLALHDRRRAVTSARLEHFEGEPEAIVDATVSYATRWLLEHVQRSGVTPTSHGPLPL